MKISYQLIALFLLASLSTSRTLAQTQSTQVIKPESGYVPHRVYSSDDKKFSDFEAMLFELSRANVVLIGEQHDDPNTHKLELAILEGLVQRRNDIAVSFEMFERDTQAMINDYAAGRINEQEFLKSSRPWPNYSSDYRPLIEFARIQKWPIIAANAPRRYSIQVSKSGLTALDSLPSTERAFIAKAIACPKDDYFKRFASIMSEHPSSPTQSTNSANNASGSGNQAQQAPKIDEAMIERMYQAQCIKDETMAESISNLFSNESAKAPLIVHYNGAFHSDYKLGTASRIKQRLPKANLKTITIIPVDSLDNIKVEEHKKRGDYQIFTLKTPEKK